MPASHAPAPSVFALSGLTQNARWCGLRGSGVLLLLWPLRVSLRSVSVPRALAVAAAAADVARRWCSSGRRRRRRVGHNAAAVSAGNGCRNGAQCVWIHTGWVKWRWGWSEGCCESSCLRRDARRDRLRREEEYYGGGGTKKGRRYYTPPLSLCLPLLSNTQIQI